MGKFNLLLKNLKICSVGAGYVGVPTMAVFADYCPDVEFNVVDINKEKIDKWNSDDLSKLPIYEPGLDDIINKVRGKNLFFSTEIENNIRKSQIIFISVNTPSVVTGKFENSSDLSNFKKCAEFIAKCSESDKIIVEKSTVPVKSADILKKIFKTIKPDLKFQILSNPEFLAEGSAIDNLRFPDRVLIGSDKDTSSIFARDLLVNVYKNWIPKQKIITTNLYSSELSKLVSNAFLAQRISSINSISALCEVTGADISEIAKAVGADSRIGGKYLKSSIGFGGSCLKKDLLNLIYLSNYYGLKEVADYWLGVLKINQFQSKRFINKILKCFNGNVNNKHINILGWAFKQNTDDSRDSPSIAIAAHLITKGAILNIHDVKVSKFNIISDLSSFWKNKGFCSEKVSEFLDRITFKKTNDIDTFNNSSAIVILTEWKEYKVLNFNKIYAVMSKPSFIFDGRKILNKSKLKSIGYKCFEIGKN